MRRARSTVVLLLLLLHCCQQILAAAPYRCIHDELPRGNMSARPPWTVAFDSPPAVGRAARQARPASSKEWRPIRFHASYRDLDAPGKTCATVGASVPNFRGGTVTCSADDIFTPERRRILVGETIPSAVKLHTERLSVQTTGEKLVVTMLSGSLMFHECDAFTVPAEHTTKDQGVDADYLLYVASSPAPTFASVCAFLRGRPAAGVLNFATPMIASTRFNIRIAAHEIAHALGFRRHSIGIAKLDFDGKRTRDDGTPIFTVLLSAAVKKVAQAHYGCGGDGKEGGMALEGKDGATYWKIGAHWSYRDAKDELMTVRMDPSSSFYSALTMALFHDLPYYKADFSKAEPMRWGKGLGCDFLKERCQKNGGISRPEMYCSAPLVAPQCTYSRLALGDCEGSPTPDKQRQHIPNRLIGAKEDIPDFCPVITSTPQTSCLDGDAERMPGSRVGHQSRCLKAHSVALKQGESKIGDICANVRCDDNSRTVRVQYKGDNEWHTCSGTLSLAGSNAFKSGTIVCPTYDEVCTHVVVSSELNTVNDSVIAAPLRIPAVVSLALFSLIAMW